jgi:hypothetical protein
VSERIDSVWSPIYSCVVHFAQSTAREPGTARLHPGRLVPRILRNPRRAFKRVPAVGIATAVAIAVAACGGGSPAASRPSPAAARQTVDQALRQLERQSARTQTLTLNLSQATINQISKGQPVSSARAIRKLLANVRLVISESSGTGAPLDSVPVTDAKKFAVDISVMLDSKPDLDLRLVSGTYYARLELNALVEQFAPGQARQLSTPQVKSASKLIPAFGALLNGGWVSLSSTALNSLLRKALHGQTLQGLLASLSPDQAKAFSALERTGKYRSLGNDEYSLTVSGSELAKVAADELRPLLKKLGGSVASLGRVAHPGIGPATYDFHIQNGVVTKMLITISAKGTTIPITVQNGVPRAIVAPSGAQSLDPLLQLLKSAAAGGGSKGILG